MYGLQQRLRGDRFSRYWYDLARLDEAGIAASAVGDDALALAVADHKSLFFAEKDAMNAPIDSRSAVFGGIRLVPVGGGRSRLEEDYEQMVADGLLVG